MKRIVATGTVTSIGDRRVTVTFDSEGHGMRQQCSVPATVEQQREWASLLHVESAVFVTLDVICSDLTHTSTEDLRAELARREERGAA